MLISHVIISNPTTKQIAWPRKLVLQQTGFIIKGQNANHYTFGQKRNNNQYTTTVVVLYAFFSGSPFFDNSKPPSPLDHMIKPFDFASFRFRENGTTHDQEYERNSEPDNMTIVHRNTQITDIYICTDIYILSINLTMRP